MKRREEGSIVERMKGKKYLIRWTAIDELTGARLRKNKIVRGDYVEAQSELSRMLRPEANEEPAPTAYTFQQYADNEWAQYVRDKWKGSTQVTQGSSVKHHILPFFGEMQLSEIEPKHISAFHTKMDQEKKLSKKTRRNLHAILTKMFRHAVVLKLIPSSPVVGELAPKLEKTEKPSLTAEQMWALFDAVPVRYKAFFMTLALTGIRTSEALGLKWADVDFAGREISVRRAIYRGKEQTPKTVGSIRPRPMVEALYEALLHHKQMSHYTTQADYVFCSSSGRPMNPDQLREALQSALQTMDIKFEQPRADGLHLLRHTSGSLVYRSTSSVKEAQEWLGHSSATITLNTYIHLMKDSQKRTAQVSFGRPQPNLAEQSQGNA